MLEKLSNQLNVKTLLIATGIAFFMLLTRGSHMLTPYALPDASIVLFFLGGLYLRRAAWFAGFFILAALIDFGAAALDPVQGFCLTDGYWGLIPAYAVMWLGGLWLSQQQNAYAIKPYIVISLVTSFLAFVISTQTYYLFSGRFPAKGLLESMQHGWEYSVSWMGYAALYFAMVWFAVYAIKQLSLSKVAKA